MNEEAEKALLEKIERLEALITHPVRKQSSFEVISNKLSEQGSQRGLIIIITAIAVNVFNADATFISDLLTGAALVYGSHDIVTPG